MATQPKQLTIKEAAFVNEMANDSRDQQAAAIRAGYSAKTAKVIAAQLVKKPHIATAIQTILAERNAAVRAGTIIVEDSKQEKECKATAGRTLNEICALAFSNIAGMFEQRGNKIVVKDIDQIPESLQRAISSVKVRRQVEGVGDNAREVEVLEFKLYDKNRAVETLAKHLGLLRERTPIEDFLNIIAL
jgi:phage terminase small subunit